MSVHFSSEKSDWETPRWLFDALNRDFQFDLDVCATQENAKCLQYFGLPNDALRLDWGWATACWMNPPYGRGIGQWVRKAYDSVQDNVNLIVCLLPARTDTRWFHEYVMKAAEVRFIKGRVKFVGAESNAPFPSMVVVFRPGMNWVPRFSSWDIKDEVRYVGKSQRV